MPNQSGYNPWSAIANPGNNQPDQKKENVIMSPDQYPTIASAYSYSAKQQNSGPQVDIQSQTSYPISSSKNVNPWSMPWNPLKDFDGQGSPI